MVVLELSIIFASVLRALIRRKSPRPRSLNQTRFTLLPPEIVQHIASYLPPSAAASFASTCLFIRLATGTRYISALRASHTEAFKLLELLLVDAPNNPDANIPSRLLCVHCARLVPGYLKCYLSTIPACIESRNISRRYIESSFSTLLFYTAMALHRHGRPYENLLARFKPPTSTNYYPVDGITSQYITRYRIAATGSLLLRRQIICIVPYRRDGGIYGLNTIFCRHIDGRDKYMYEAIALMQTEARRGIRRPLSDFHWCATVIQ